MNPLKVVLFLSVLSMGFRGCDNPKYYLTAIPAYTNNKTMDAPVQLQIVDNNWLTSITDTHLPEIDLACNSMYELEIWQVNSLTKKANRYFDPVYITSDNDLITVNGKQIIIGDTQIKRTVTLYMSNTNRKKSGGLRINVVTVSNNTLK